MTPLVASPAVRVFSRPIEILLVEDEPGDVRLTVEALRDTRMRNRIHTVEDGVEALDFLHRRPPYADAPRPDLILLDLNLPRKSGREVLGEIKADPVLRMIPVIVLTTSNAQDDVQRSYDLHANCFISKPMDWHEFNTVVKSIEEFWFTVARLPSFTA
jgi:chemotaxis family two-component system response regulator Rcp1